MQIDQNFPTASYHSSLQVGESLNHLCEELNLRTDELQAIMGEVGPSIEAIRDYLALRNLRRECLF